jgi:hypothetical protein
MIDVFFTKKKKTPGQPAPREKPGERADQPEAL